MCNLIKDQYQYIHSNLSSESCYNLLLVNHQKIFWPLKENDFTTEVYICPALWRRVRKAIYFFFFAFQWLTSTLIPYCVGFKIFWGNCCQESFSQLCRLALIQSWDGHKISLGYICRLKNIFPRDSWCPFWL